MAATNNLVSHRLLGPAHGSTGTSYETRIRARIKGSILDPIHRPSPSHELLNSPARCRATARLIRAAIKKTPEALVAFRRAEPSVRQTNFLSGQPVRPGGLPDASWYSTDGKPIDWTQNERSLVCLLAAVPREDATAPPNHHLLLLCHSGDEPCTFTLPPITRTIRWRTLLDTAAPTPGDIYPELDGPPLPSTGIVQVESRSMVCFVAPDTW